MTVTVYIANLPQPQRGIASALRKFIKQAAPRAAESIKWNMPHYAANGGCCSIYPCRSHVNLQIFHGAQLDDKSGILEGTGKEMRHVKIHSKDEIPAAAIKRLIKQAVALNAARRSGSTSSKRRRG